MRLSNFDGFSSEKHFYRGSREEEGGKRIIEEQLIKLERKAKERKQTIKKLFGMLQVIKEKIKVKIIGLKGKRKRTCKY